jgi:protein-disulfide isomerase
MQARSFDEAELRGAILGAGGDWERLQAERTENGQRISEQLAANQRDALALGLQGTPGYLIGPVLVEGAVTEAEFLRAFQQARATR